MTWGIDHMEKVSPQYGFCVISDYQLVKMTWAIDHMKKFSPQNVFFCFQWTPTRKWLGTLITWVLLCFFIWLSWENDLGHWSHIKGFSPVWNLLWVLRLLPTENDLGQWLHGKGFSPVWFFVFFQITSLWKWLGTVIMWKSSLPLSYIIFCLE